MHSGNAGKAVRPYLNRSERQHLKECFDMIDTDGSDAVDALELRAVFTVRITVSVKRLGLHISSPASLC